MRHFVSPNGEADSLARVDLAVGLQAELFRRLPERVAYFISGPARPMLLALVTQEAYKIKLMKVRGSRIGPGKLSVR